MRVISKTLVGGRKSFKASMKTIGRMDKTIFIPFFLIYYRKPALLLSRSIKWGDSVIDLPS